MADSVSLSQDELNLILSNIRKDNDEHEKIPDSSGVSLSQADLEKLFGGSSSGAQKSAGNSVEPDASQSSSGEHFSEQTADEIRAAKIAERKRHAAELLAQANANSPKRISVVYGTATRRGKEIENLKVGDTIKLDRIVPEYADILVDGKLFARGAIEDKDGHATITIAQIVDE